MGSGRLQCAQARCTVLKSYSALCSSTPRCAQAHRTVLKFSTLYFTVRILYLCPQNVHGDNLNTNLIPSISNLFYKNF